MSGDLRKTAKAFRARLNQCVKQSQPEELNAHTPLESSIAIAELIRSSRASIYIQAESLSRRIWDDVEISWEISRAFHRGVFVEVATTSRAEKEDSFAFWTLRRHGAFVRMRSTRKFQHRFVAVDRQHTFLFGTPTAQKGGTVFFNDRFKAVSKIVDSQRSDPH